MYRGADAVPHAVEALREAEKLSMRRAYVTNNASRTPEAVAEHLNELGVSAYAGEVVTSAQAAARMARSASAPGRRVLVIGGEGLSAAVRERGLVPVASADDLPDIVVQGYAPDLSWKDLAEAAYAVQRQVPWIATNTDLSIPTARGIAPGNGTLVNAVRRRPARPRRWPASRSCRCTASRSCGRARRKPLVVGDRLDTDIEGAVRGATDSLLVFTGVVKPADLVTAPRDKRPSYISPDLRGLLVPHHAPAREGAGWKCAKWTAAVVSGQVVLHGYGEAADGLKAICAAVWGQEDDGVGVEDVDAVDALAQLTW